MNSKGYPAIYQGQRQDKEKQKGKVQVDDTGV